MSKENCFQLLVPKVTVDERTVEERSYMRRGMIANILFIPDIDDKFTLCHKYTANCKDVACRENSCTTFF